MKKMGMKHSVMLTMMAVSAAHAASKEVSVADVCNLPEGARSMYEKMTIVSNGVSVVLSVPEGIWGRISTLDISPLRSIGICSHLAHLGS